MAADPLPTVPGPDVPAGPATMLELGAALGADVWWLDRIFALTGGWVPTTPEAGVRTHLAELSRVAGDHGLALRALLPRPAPVDPAAWVVEPSPAASVIVAEMEASQASAPRLSVVHRVLLPRLLGPWARTTGPSSVGVARALRHARTDLAELRDEGEVLLQALMAADERNVGDAHSAALRVEGLLVARGGMHPPPPSSPPI